MPSSRRTVLVALAAGVAGCTGLSDDGPGESASPSPPTGTDADRPSPGPDDGCTGGYDLRAAPFDPAEGLVADLTPDAREVLAAAVADDGTTETTYRGPSLDRDVYVVYDERYYRTDFTRSIEEVTAFLLDASWESGRTAPDDATVVEYGTLPAVDRRALDLGLFPEDERGHPTEGLTVREFPAPYPGGADESRLVGAGTVWVRREGRDYRVEVDGRTTAERRTYEYAVERVAGDAAGFRRAIADRYLVVLDDQSRAVREIVETAIDDSYEECTPPSDDLRTLLDELPEDERLPSPADGWYVAYEDTRYELTANQWVH